MGGNKSLQIQKGCPEPGKPVEDARVKTGVFLQVRLNSRRLPEKALLLLPGGNVVRHCMRSLKPIEADNHVLLTDESSAPVLAGWAKDEGFTLFTGPSEDVLKRFCMAIRFFGVSRVIRACGDNPLVSARLAEMLLTIHEKKGLDLSHFIDIPLGTGVEVIQSKALLESERRSSDPYEHEHITTHAYRHPEDFKVEDIPCPGQYFLPQARVTLDTEPDYRLISRIFRDLYRHRPVEIDEVIDWFKRKGSFKVPTAS